MAGLRSQLLSDMADQCRERLWADQGVALDPREREVILAHPADNSSVSRVLHIIHECQHRILSSTATPKKFFGFSKIQQLNIFRSSMISYVDTVGHISCIMFLIFNQQSDHKIVYDETVLIYLVYHPLNTETHFFD